mmetsp:Transcript_18588/g.53727  ORF Transcript_18588/g.53727 Transcript_18588/m.53727 type:complete len:400 (+) Transcript_18588:808-2007(+)
MRRRGARDGRQIALGGPCRLRVRQESRYGCRGVGNFSGDNAEVSAQREPGDCLHVGAGAGEEEHQPKLAHAAPRDRRAPGEDRPGAVQGLKAHAFVAVGVGRELPDRCHRHDLAGPRRRRRDDLDADVRRASRWHPEQAGCHFLDAVCAGRHGPPHGGPRRPHPRHGQRVVRRLRDEVRLHVAGGRGGPGRLVQKTPGGPGADGARRARRRAVGADAGRVGTGDGAAQGERGCSRKNGLHDGRACEAVGGRGLRFRRRDAGERDGQGGAVERAGRGCGGAARERPRGCAEGHVAGRGGGGALSARARPFGAGLRAVRERRAASVAGAESRGGPGSADGNGEARAGGRWAAARRHSGRHRDVLGQGRVPRGQRRRLRGQRGDASTGLGRRDWPRGSGLGA